MVNVGIESEFVSIRFDSILSDPKLINNAGAQQRQRLQQMSH